MVLVSSFRVDGSLNACYLEGGEPGTLLDVDEDLRELFDLELLLLWRG